MVDFDPNKPNGDPFYWNYFFDIIDDSNSAVGKFSINSIGRRIKSVRDDNITIIYPRTVEPDYKDSSNRDVKIILYEDLTSVPIDSLYTLTVTDGNTVSAATNAPVDIKVDDKIIIDQANSNGTLPASFIGAWSITTVSSDLKSFGFSTTGTTTNTVYYINFDRNTYTVTNSGSTTIKFFTGSETIYIGMSVSGPGIVANAYVNNVSTDSTSVSVVLRPLGATTNIPFNVPFSFSYASASLAKYSDFQNANADALQIEAEFESLEIPYVSILKSQIEDYLNNEDFQYKSDAFSAMKNLAYIHTNFNQAVSVNAIPLYFLEPNKRIHLSDINTEIFGDHYLQSFSIPLSNDGIMQMSAIKIQEE
jgi:hypothetical protein